MLAKAGKQGAKNNMGTFIGLFIFAVIMLVVIIPTFIQAAENRKQRKRYKEVKKYAQSVMKEMGLGSKKDRELAVKQAMAYTDKIIKETEERMKTIMNECNMGVFKNPDNDDYEPFYTKIVGVTKGNRQKYLQECFEGQSLTIKWDINNKYSDHALAVYAEIDGQKRQLGFIPDETAKELVERYFVDEYSELEAYIIELTGGTEDKPTIGCNIEIFI